MLVMMTISKASLVLYITHDHKISFHSYVITVQKVIISEMKYKMLRLNCIVTDTYTTCQENNVKQITYSPESADLTH